MSRFLNSQIFMSLYRKSQRSYGKTKGILLPRNYRKIPLVKVIVRKIAYKSLFVQRILPLSPLRYPPDPPRNPGSRGGVVLFALISFLIVQIFSEKVQNVANYLKILFKKVQRTYFSSEKDYFHFSKKDFAFLLNFGRRKFFKNIS